MEEVVSSVCATVAALILIHEIIRARPKRNGVYRLHAAEDKLDRHALNGESVNGVYRRLTESAHTHSLNENHPEHLYDKVPHFCTRCLVNDVRVQSHEQQRQEQKHEECCGVLPSESSRETGGR